MSSDPIAQLPHRSSIDRKDDLLDELSPPTLHAQLARAPADTPTSFLGAGNNAPTVRPPIEYGSPGAFVRSVSARFASLWTRRFALSLLAGQVVSLCITCTNVTTTELVGRNWALPTTQTWFL